MLILNFIGQVSFFLIERTNALIFPTILLIGYIPLYILVINKDVQFKNKIRLKINFLYTLIGILSVCYAVSFVITGLSLFTIEAILINELICLIFFDVLLIYDKILGSPKNNIIFISECIIVFCGIWIGYTFSWSITFNLIHYSGQHPPIGLFLVNLIFLIVSTLAVIIKNLYQNYRSVR